MSDFDDDEPFSDAEPADEDEEDYVYEEEDEDGVWDSAAEGAAGAGAGASPDPAAAGARRGSTAGGDAPGAAAAESFDPAALRAERDAAVALVADGLGVTASVATALLLHFRWSARECMDRFRLEAAELCERVGVSVWGEEEEEGAAPEEADGGVLCNVCFESCAAEMAFALGCGHAFCLECWGAYLGAQVNNEGSKALKTTCPQSGCPRAVTTAEFDRFLEGDLRDKLDNLLTLSFVDDNAALAWCPRPGCGCAVRGAEGDTVACRCGLEFCFGCGAERHAPATCEHLRNWAAKDRSEETLDAKYLFDKTKPCPACGARTEKISGCMFLTCASCSVNWCWACGQYGPNVHHVYDCNRPPEENWGVASPDQEDQRFFFYFERYHNHKDSRKFAQKQRTAAAARVSLLDAADDANVADVQFLTRAVELVIDCRLALQYSYVYAYHEADPARRELFQYAQKNLETYTEFLSGLTERPLTELIEQRQQCISWTMALKDYLKHMREWDAPHNHPPLESQDSQESDYGV